VARPVEVRLSEARHEMPILSVWGCDYDSGGLYFVRLPWIGDEPTYVAEVPFRLRKSEESWRAVRRIPSMLNELIQFDSTDTVFVEHGFGANRKSDWVLARVQGAIFASLPDDLSVNEIGGGEWKKIFCGKGNASKKDPNGYPVIRRCEELGFLPADDNIADAYGMSWAGRKLLADAFAKE
jgi:Holliday junction resolvasome RuvABC endonuclease subunit